MSFETEMYQVVRSAVSSELLTHLDTEFEIVKNVEYLQQGKDPNDLFAINDTQVTNSFAYYSALCFESLSLMLKPIMEEVTGKQLYPTYTYARIYYNGAEMAIHKDRPSCEYSCTINISVDPTPWDIWFEALNGEHRSITLYPGDLIVYRGDILNHWRVPYEGNRQTQAFLHYVDKNGKHRDYKYDKRPYIGLRATTRGPY